MTSHFPLQTIYLNHAAVSPWPQCTHDAVARFAADNLHYGAKHYPKWLQVEQELRQRLQQLLHADSADEIALVKNTSEALSVIAYGLDWQAGDNVVLYRHEFPSNRIVWESLQQRYNIEVRLVDYTDPVDPEAALLAATDQNTRLLTTSSVQYGSGLRLDLARLGEYCQQHNILFCIDAIQSLGAFELDVNAVHADFVVADGHKWLLAAEGLAVFYCRAQHLATLQLQQYGWHMVEQAGDYDRMDWQPAKTAKRFECGSPNMLGIHALHASVGLLLEISIATISQRITAHMEQLLAGLKPLSGISIKTPLDPLRRAGILNFQFSGIDHAALQQRLLQKNVICAYRAGGIRLSPHYYHEPAELAQAIEILKQQL